MGVARYFKFLLFVLLGIAGIVSANAQITINVSAYGSIYTKYDKTPQLGVRYIIDEWTKYVSGANGFGGTASGSVSADEFGNIYSSSQSSFSYAYFEFDLSGFAGTANTVSLNFQLTNYFGHIGNLAIRGDVANPGDISIYTSFEDLGGFQIASTTLNTGDSGSLLSLQLDPSAAAWINSNPGSTFSIALSLLPVTPTNPYLISGEFSNSAGSLPFLSINDPSAIPHLAPMH